MRTFFEAHVDSPPAYPHLPPVANKLLWLRGFKIHIQVISQDPFCDLLRSSSEICYLCENWEESFSNWFQ